MVGDRGVDECEFLQTSHSPESKHCPLSSSKECVGILRPIVEPPPRFLPICPTQFLEYSAVRTELVGHKDFRPLTGTYCFS